MLVHSTTIMCFLALVMLFFVLSVFKGVERFMSGGRSTIYDHPTKCFSCEQDIIARFGPEWGWMGQDTKSFDAEREMIHMTQDVGAAIDTHPIRYY